MDLKEKIRSIPDFPIEGVLFRDVTTLLKDKDGYHTLIEVIADSLRDRQVDLVVGPEARGFVIGAALAYALRAGFVLARKPGKLPCETMRYEYGLEYGTDVLEIHKDAIQPGQRSCHRGRPARNRWYRAGYHKTRRDGGRHRSRRALRD